MNFVFVHLKIWNLSRYFGTTLVCTKLRTKMLVIQGSKSEQELLTGQTLITLGMYI